jgi:hypothetical protein
MSIKNTSPIKTPGITWPVLSLLASSSTLICCALPALMVALGAGAVLAGMISAAPWLSILSTYKVTLFIGAGVLLGLAGVMQWRARLAPCPADPALARACGRLRRIGVWVWGVSAVLYATGFFFAFLAADLFYG